MVLDLVSILLLFKVAVHLRLPKLLSLTRQLELNLLQQIMTQLPQIYLQGQLLKPLQKKPLQNLHTPVNLSRSKHLLLFASLW